jgi:hypothetical protein
MVVPHRIFNLNSGKWRGRAQEEQRSAARRPQAYHSAHVGARARPHECRDISICTIYCKIDQVAALQSDAFDFDLDTSLACTAGTRGLCDHRPDHPGLSCISLRRRLCVGQRWHQFLLLQVSDEQFLYVERFRPLISLAQAAAAACGRAEILNFWSSPCCPSADSPGALDTG